MGKRAGKALAGMALGAATLGAGGMTLEQLDAVRACGSALVTACGVEQHELWNGYEPWRKCPTETQPGSGPVQTECEARVLERHPGCAALGRSWQSRPECWPKEEGGQAAPTASPEEEPTLTQR